MIQSIIQSIILVVVVWVAGKLISRQGSQNAMAAFWDTVDISDNLQRVMHVVHSVPPGWLSVGYGAGSALIGLLWGVCAWHYDFASSWDAMTPVRIAIGTSIGGFAYATYLLAALTYLPTITELFGATFAKFNIRVVQLVVIALSIFDLFTDLPRVQETMNQFWGFFSQGGVLGGFGWYLVFAMWWFLASYGFELLTVIFLWAAVAFAIRGIIGVLGSPDDDAGRSRGGADRARRARAEG